MSLFSMENNKHVACEVPIAYKLEDCWKLTQTSEKMKKHCIMLENCNYNQEELWILNMIPVVHIQVKVYLICMEADIFY